MGAQERVEVGPLGDRAAGKDREDAEAGEPAQHVGQELEARRVGQVDVVEQQHERPVADRVLDRVDRRLQQARAHVLGRRAAARRRGGAAEPARQRRCDDREILGPGGVGGGRGEVLGQVAQQLRPERVGRRAAELQRRAGGRARAGGAGALDELARQARLADPRLAAHDRHPGAQLQQRVELGVAPDDRRRTRRAAGGCGGCAAHPCCGRTRLGRRREPELRSQALGEPVVHRERRRAVAVVGQALHEVARRRLVERIELQAPAGVRDGELGRGRTQRQPCKERAQPRGLAVALLQHPVLIEVGEQRTAVQGRRRLELVTVDEGVELLQVGRAVQGDPLASGDERVGAAVAQRPAQRPGGAAQRRAGARVQHVGPESRGESAARMLAGMQREPREQLPRPAARGLLDAAAVDVRLQRAEQPDPEHAAILRRCTVHAPLTVG